MNVKETIRQLTHLYGVSGDEFRVSKLAAEMMKPLCDRVEIDDFGNVYGWRDAEKPGAKTVQLDAHIDQIGFIITDVTDEGFLRFAPVGGVDQRMLLGSELTVLTRDGQERLGVVAAMPPHLQKTGEQKNSVPIADMALDVGMDGEQAKEVFHVGDFAAFANDMLELQGDAICGKAFDDRACLGDGAVVSLGSNSRPDMAEAAMEVARAKRITHLADECASASGTNAWPMQMQQEGVKTLVISLIDVDSDVKNEIAKDLCAFFNQESVMITEGEIRAYFINDTLGQGGKK